MVFNSKLHYSKQNEHIIIPKETNKTIININNFSEKAKRENKIGH